LGDDQVEVAFAGFVLEHGAEHRDGADPLCDQIRQAHAHQAADDGDGQGFGKELEADVPAAGP